MVATSTPPALSRVASEPVADTARPGPQRSVTAALEALRVGGFVVVVDDADREDEGDLVIAAEFTTAEAVAFLLRHTSGVICVALDPARCDALDLPAMVSDNTAPLGTAFTVSVDAAHGTSTGISASDRARTIQVLADPATRPDELVRPGHVFPLRAARGGVAERAGHTEACVELARRAGLEPAMVLCEMTSPDRLGMADGSDIRQFATRFGIPVVRVGDLVGTPDRDAADDSIGGVGQGGDVRCGPTARPTRPDPVRVTSAPVPTRYGAMTAYAYRSSAGIEHLAVVHGDPWRVNGPALVRLHSECLTGDVLGSLRCDCGQQLDLALRTIVAHGSGVVVYLRGHEGRGIGLAAKLAAYQLQDAGLDTVDANLQLGLPVDSRDYCDAASILRDLGLRRVLLLSNNPDKVRGLVDEGLIVTRRELAVPPGPDNRRYLQTKATRLGHDLPQVMADVG